MPRSSRGCTSGAAWTKYEESFILFIFFKILFKSILSQVLHKKGNESAAIQTLAVLDQTAKFPRKSEMGSK